MEKCCELFRIIPRDKVCEVFRKSKTVCAECSHSFLGFEKVYKAVTMFVPKDKIIIDLGCGYAFQSWYFRDYKRYVGVDCGVKPEDVLRLDNSDYYFMTIQDFCKKSFAKLGCNLDDVFAIASHVPDDDARTLVRTYFPHCLVYYPTIIRHRKEVCNAFKSN